MNMTMNDYIIEVQNIIKDYNDFRAVDGHIEDQKNGR